MFRGFLSPVRPACEISVRKLVDILPLVKWSDFYEHMRWLPLLIASCCLIFCYVRQLYWVCSLERSERMLMWLPISLLWPLLSMLLASLDGGSKMAPIWFPLLCLRIDMTLLFTRWLFRLMREWKPVAAWLLGRPLNYYVVSGRAPWGVCIIFIWSTA